MKEIEITLVDKKIKPELEFVCTILVNYSSRYDGVVLNTQIMDSNELMLFTCLNGKKINTRSSRLFIPKDSMPNGKAEVCCLVTFTPKQKHQVKFRASIIEQHKEVESDVVFAELS